MKRHETEYGSVCFTKPGEISAEGKRILAKMAVTVVEVADPSAVTVVRPMAAMDGETLLLCAAKALQDNPQAMRLFINALTVTLEEKIAAKDGFGSYTAKAVIR